MPSNQAEPQCRTCHVVPGKTFERTLKDATHDGGDACSRHFGGVPVGVRGAGTGESSAIIEVLNANLTIIYEKGEDGFWIATIPEVPGAFSQGKTKKEARENAIDAMQELMTARRELALRERMKGATYETLSFQS